MTLPLLPRGDDVTEFLTHSAEHIPAVAHAAEDMSHSICVEVVGKPVLRARETRKPFNRVLDDDENEDDLDLELVRRKQLLFEEKLFSLRAHPQVHTHAKKKESSFSKFRSSKLRL